MKTLLHVDLTFDQVLDIVKQLPPQQKLWKKKLLTIGYLACSNLSEPTNWTGTP